MNGRAKDLGNDSEKLTMSLSRLWKTAAKKIGQMLAWEQWTWALRRGIRGGHYEPGACRNDCQGREAPELTGEKSSRWQISMPASMRVQGGGARVLRESGEERSPSLRTRCSTLGGTGTC